MLSIYVMNNSVYNNLMIAYFYTIEHWFYIIDLGHKFGFCEMILNGELFKRMERDVLRERFFRNKILFSYYTMPLTEISLSHVLLF